MALNPQSMADALMKKYEDYCKDPDGKGEFIQIFNKALDDYFQQNAQFSTPNVTMTGAKGAMAITIVPEPTLQAAEIATKIANYWALTITPDGIPTSGVITAIVNTAPTIIAPLTAGILTIPATVGSNPDNYLTFCNMVIAQIKTIAWTVTETQGTSAITIPVTVI